MTDQHSERIQELTNSVNRSMAEVHARLNALKAQRMEFIRIIENQQKTIAEQAEEIARLRNEGV